MIRRSIKFCTTSSPCHIIRDFLVTDADNVMAMTDPVKALAQQIFPNIPAKVNAALCIW